MRLGLSLGYECMYVTTIGVSGILLTINIWGDIVSGVDAGIVKVKVSF